MPYRVENNVRKGEIACNNISFSRNVFHIYTSLMRQSVVLCGNGLTRFRNHDLSCCHNIYKTKRQKKTGRLQDIMSCSPINYPVFYDPGKEIL